MRFMIKQDIAVLRELVKQYAEVAALPEQAEKIRLWQKLNGLEPERPMFMIDQLPWNELEYGDELTLRCGDATCRMIETDLRRLLYRSRYLQDDFAYEPVLRVPKKIIGVDFDPTQGICFDYGISIDHDTIAAEKMNTTLSHHYHDQLDTFEALERLRAPQIMLDEAESARREEIAHLAADGILPVLMDGFGPWCHPWDDIFMWRGTENVFYDLADEPEKLHATVRKIMDINLNCLDQLEEKGLLCAPQPLVHCTGAWSQALPAHGYDPAHPRAKDIWTYGMAQMLYTVSPEQHAQLEFAYVHAWYERFGLVYYGCCEPLEGERLEHVLNIPNLRKVSVSHWVKDREAVSERFAGRYVMSFKPSPSYLVDPAWDPSFIEENLKGLCAAAAKFATPCELILKDVSTVNHHPERLMEWAKIARRVVER